MRKWSRAYSLLFLSFSILMLISGTAAQNKTQGSQKDVLIQLDQATWISDINWNPENSSNIQVTIHSEIPKPVGLQEIPDYSGRSGKFSPMKQVTLSTGKTTVSVPANGRGKLGIAVTDSNDGAYYMKKSRPLIGSISRADFYLFGIMVAVSVVTHIFFRGYISKLVLSRNPQEVA